MRWSRRNRCLAAVLPLVVAAGCWHDDDPVVTTTVTTPSTATVSPTLQAICQPLILEGRLPAFITACQYPDTEMKIENVSTVMLTVSAPNAVVRVSSGQIESLADAVRADLTVSATLPFGVHRLPPRATARVTFINGPPRVHIDFDQVAFSQYAADVLVKWVEKRLSGPGLALSKSFASCAKEIGEVWEREARQGKQYTPIEVFIFDAALIYRACSSFVRDVEKHAQVPPPATWTAELRSVAKEYPTTFVDDAFKYVRRLLLAWK
ncbi:hypothetical protein [Actinokineospora alba]|uniref:hypothetical protein n=1 Tax=Actinokineospora alba TaxID=504798 RepID=UPI00105BBB00|nr:hypothetical protein [Actinokineospora alba]